MKFFGFHDLMQFQVREILFVSSLYDAFVLEEDARLAEKIFSEYLALHLPFIPRITKVSSGKTALQKLSKQSFDLIIITPNIADIDPIELSKMVKQIDSGKTVIFLAYDLIPPDFLHNIRETESIDRIFYWSGNTKIFFSIIKMVEDFKNVEHDASAGVQVILIIENSPKFYSALLPVIYTEIMIQTERLLHDGINDLHRMLRMRARPKILLAESFEEALSIINKYKYNLLGIISDTRFLKDGKMDKDAGFKLEKILKEEISDLPILLHSSEVIDQHKIKNISTYFLDRNSPEFFFELHNFILRHFGFGDFIFSNSKGQKIGKASTLAEFANKIETIPAESLLFHAQRNHFSTWFRARTEFEAAEELRPKKVSDFKDTESLRKTISRALHHLQEQLKSGYIKNFSPLQTYYDGTFTRIGDGSIGSKGRGIAFINSLLSDTTAFSKFKNIEIKTPHTFALGSGVFEDFMNINNLMTYALKNEDPQKLSRRFKGGKFPNKILNDLKLLLGELKQPIAVRSSSILEDSQNLPFSGIYKTYMLPNNHPNPEIKLKQLTDAIKLIYASIFYREPKQFIKNSEYRLEDEKMAVLIQEMAGRQFGNIFYPVVSGVAQSYNYYPISHMEPEEGIVHLAMGLGKTIVGGENIFRFSPVYPQMNLPYSSANNFFKKSQRIFYALNMSDPSITVEVDENFSLLKLDISQAEADGTLFFTGSTYSSKDESIQDTLSIEGPRVISFANILKYDIFPLAEILRSLLKIGQEGFGTNIEIEFALNLSKNSNIKPKFSILQIRPMATKWENKEVTFTKKDIENSVCKTNLAIGNGILTDIHDLVYVDPLLFDFSRTQHITIELELINRELKHQNKFYILIGFGRWGSTDPSLGIPVEWHQISNAKVLIESNLDHAKIDPSLGSHFFHNLISLRLGYFHIKGIDHEEFINWEWIKSQSIQNETETVKHIHFDIPLIVKIEGNTRRGLILKPN